MFQFRCPQGHVLQGDLSQVGQMFQCPMCGSSFWIPPPTMDPAAAGGFFQGPGTWPAANAPGPSFPAQGGMPGMMPPQTMPMMPSGPYPMPAAQPFAFGPAAVNPLAPGMAAEPAAPAETSPQAAETAAPSETGKPRFDLGFDPTAKASLPFDIADESEGEAGSAPVAPLPAPSFPAPSLPAPSFSAPSFPAPTFSAPSFPAPSFPAPSFATPSFATPPFPGETLPAADFPAPSMPPPAFEPGGGGEDVPFAQAAPDEEETTAQGPPRILHIRCPSGHLVKAKSDLLGKNGRCPACKKTFELRYENSVEFQRRREKILQREEIKTGRSWMAWAILASFLVFVGLVAMIVMLNR